MSRFVLAMLLAAPAAAQPLDLPARAPTARPGSAILPLITGLSVRDREALIWTEVRSGNVPAFLRQLVPITIQRADAQSRVRTVVLEIAPDYLALGSDSDFFRMPMTPGLAQQIADSLGCSLTTRRIADDIWAAAPVKLNPVTFSPSIYDILSPAVFWQQNAGIEAQRAGRPLGQIVAGTKKDVVVTARLATTTGRVAIYGWHWPSGSPIQPLSTVHESTYADYSHGARLVRSRVLVDGQPIALATLLADPVLHPLLGDEGAFTTSRYPIAQPFDPLPSIDAFPMSGLELSGWRAKFVTPTVQQLAPASRAGDGWVVVVEDPAGGTDSIRLGHVSFADQVVQADVFCEHRPGLAADGFERVGIFARDRAQGAFDGTSSQSGACYALAWDSADGRLWCMRASGGVRTDLLAQPVHLASTAWRRFRIEARGSSLRFFVDGALVLATTDSTFASGELGIGYHEFFQTNANTRGARADNFFADSPDALRLLLEPGASGATVFDVRRGVPHDIYFSPITLAPGAYPNGWFFGIDPTLAALGSLLSTGHPAFIGWLDRRGEARASLIGIPPGLTLWAVSIDVLQVLPPVAASAPISFTTP